MPANPTNPALVVLRYASSASAATSLAMFLASAFSAEQCFTSPCFPGGGGGGGVASLWEASKALGFQSVGASCAALFFAACARRLASADDPAPGGARHLELVLGAGGLAMLLSLQTAALFGSLSEAVSQVTRGIAALPSGQMLAPTDACTATAAAGTAAACAAVQGCAWAPVNASIFACSPRPGSAAAALAGCGDMARPADCAATGGNSCGGGGGGGGGSGPCCEWVLLRCQAVYQANGGARARFDAVAAFSAINMLLQAGIMYLLVRGGAAEGGLRGTERAGGGARSSNKWSKCFRAGSGSFAGSESEAVAFGGGANETVASTYRDL